MKKTYITPEAKVYKVNVNSIIAASISIGDDLTNGTFTGQSKDDMLDIVEDDGLFFDE